MSRSMYFAYGSNLGLRHRRRRCPGATVVGRARLPGYRLSFTRYSRHRRGGVADIVPESGAEVWGVLYDVDEACLAALDEYEGVPRHYRRETVRVIDDKGGEREAMAYITHRTGEFAPSRRYLAIIVRGARAHGLPDDYIRAIDQVRADAPRRRPVGARPSGRTHA